MPEKKVVREDQGARKKRLLKYGLVVVVAVAFAVSLIVSWMVLMPFGGEYLGKVIEYTVLCTLGAAVLSVIFWFAYIKLILKQ